MATYSGSCGTNASWSLDTTTGVLNISGSGSMNSYANITGQPWSNYRSYIKSVIVAEEVTVIGQNAFSHCTSLISATIPDSVTILGAYAFRECTLLENVFFGENSKLNIVALYAFYNCTSLSSITIPSSVEEIGNYAFYGCASLTSITIPDSVTSIMERAFQNCTSLISVTIGNGITSIDGYVFRGCTSLTEITIPDGVTTIGENTFYGCTSLTTINIPDSVTDMGTNVFNDCTSLISVTIGDGVTIIGNGMFWGCTSLTSVTIGDSVTSIGGSAFNRCESLTSIIIPDCVTSIGDYAFYYCTLLTDVYYTGSEEEWNAIEIGSNNNSLGNATIHFNYIACEHIFDNGVITTAPTCTNKGLKTFICTVCGEVHTEEIDAFGHIYESVITNPTCTEKGYTTYTCSRCGDIYTSDYIPALGHIDENNDGYCDRESCGVPFCDHIGKDTVLKGAYDATCTEEGYTGDQHCGICDEIIEYGVKIQALGHNTSHTVAKNATCSASGNYEYWYCDVCNTYFKDEAFTIATTIDTLTIPIDPNAHIWNDGVVTTPPTIEQNGVKTYTCTLCGETKTELINKISSIASGVCGDNLTWELYDNGALYIKGTGEMTNFSGASSIPWYDYRDSITTINISSGVTTIGDRAFGNIVNLESVTMPDGIISIGSRAFYGCSSLTSVTLTNSVTSIGNLAFSSSSLLTDVYYYGSQEDWSVISIGSGNDYLLDANIHHIIACGECGNNLTWILDYSGVLTIYGTGDMYDFEDTYDQPWYSNRQSIKKVIVEDGVTSIGDEAFQYCTSLISVTIPDSVTSIGNGAFNGCASLTSVTIGNGVTNIENFAFAFCESLASITIPDSVTSIGNSVFYECTSLTSATIGNGVTSILNYEFFGCSSLTTITIPISVTSIGVSAFNSCDSLEDVRYGGSKKDWNLISIKNNNNPLLNAKIYLSNGGNSNIIDCGICGEDLIWTLYVDGTLVISGTGRMTDYTSLSSVPWDQYRYKLDDDDELYIKTISIEDGATSISEHAFVYCSDATYVSLPKSIISIGSNAFYFCASLKAVHTSDIESWCNIDFGNTRSNPAYFIGNLYFGYKLATEITIPNITEIKKYTFVGCQNITSATIPDSVTSIGYMAFGYCESLKSVMIHNSVTNIDDCAFQECVSLEDVYYSGTEEEWNNIVIGDKNDPLINAKIHFVSNIFGNGLIWSFDADSCTLYISGIGTMEDYQSYINVPWVKHMSDIVTINISYGVKNIGDRAFCHCENLTTVSFENNSALISIGKYAFYQCVNMTEFNVPASVKNISYTAFYECSSLDTISVDSENTSYCSNNGILYTKDNKTLVHYPSGKSATFTIPSNVEKIGNYAFATNEKLTTITIPSGVTSIGYAAFKDCTALQNMTIPTSVKTIGIIAFLNCTTLETMTFSSGSTVMSIGHGAFSYCTALTSVNLEACGQLKEIRYYTFRGCSSLNYKNISLPSGIKVGYQAFYGCINAT